MLKEKYHDYIKYFGRYEYSDIPPKAFPEGIRYIIDGEYAARIATKEKAICDSLCKWRVLPSGDENAVHWFLEDKIDTRSSNFLEDAATEIQVQGLEVDYSCVLWDADMRCNENNNNWEFYRFNGNTKWIKQEANTESKQEQIKYMLNAYRVLLTRARVGMVICVPRGNANKTLSGFWEDSTRLPEYYDNTYNYLKSLGIKEL